MAAEKKAPPIPSGKDSRGSRGAQGGLAIRVVPDEALAAVVGSDPITRAALTRKIWDYVKSHQLQDPNDRRNIQADEKLKRVFNGRDSVTMFEMTRLVNEHVSSI